MCLLVIWGSTRRFLLNVIKRLINSENSQSQKKKSQIFFKHWKHYFSKIKFVSFYISSRKWKIQQLFISDVKFIVKVSWGKNPYKWGWLLKITFFCEKDSISWFILMEMPTFKSSSSVSSTIPTHKPLFYVSLREKKRCLRWGIKLRYERAMLSMQY